MFDRHITPVTILTGFLGSGKTTMLNHVLRQMPGRRIAVIENEYGDVGIDHELVIGAEEQLLNGCVCCTVRGDLIRVLQQFEERKEGFDHIIVETTGLADPTPVAQTFLLDADIQQVYQLDGIVTVVDAVNISRHLDRNLEARKQIGFADVLVVNKTDLVEESALAELTSRLKRTNSQARLIRTTKAKVEPSDVLNLRGFDLTRALEVEPAFREVDYPFTYGAGYQLKPGEYTLSFPAVSHTHACCEHHEVDEDASDQDRQHDAHQHTREVEEDCHGHHVEFALLPLAGDFFSKRVLSVADNAFQADGEHLHSGEVISPSVGLFSLHMGEKEADIKFRMPREGQVALFAHHHEENGTITLADSKGLLLKPKATRVFPHRHRHDNVSSFVIRLSGALELDKVNPLIRELLEEYQDQIYRMKGFLSIKGVDQRYLFQAVHNLFSGDVERPWGEDTRESTIVIIGEDLPRREIEQLFEACLAK